MRRKRQKQKRQNLASADRLGRLLIFPVEWREIALPAWAEPEDHFAAITISSSNFRPEGVMPGDVAIIHLHNEIESGQFAAVRMPQGVRVGYVYHTGSTLLISSDGASGIADFTEILPTWILGKIIRIERDL